MCSVSLTRQTDPHCRFYSTGTTSVFLSFVVNKSLKPSDSIDQSLVSCLIHCHSPTASVLYFTLQNWTSVWRSFSFRDVWEVSVFSEILMVLKEQVFQFSISNQFCMTTCRTTWPYKMTQKTNHFSWTNRLYFHSVCRIVYVIHTF